MRCSFNAVIILLISFLLISCSDEGSQYTNQAVSKHLENGDIRSALLVAKQIVNETPNEAEARFLLANVYYQLGDLHNANIEWQKGDRYTSKLSTDIDKRILTLIQLGDFEGLSSLSEKESGADYHSLQESALILSDYERADNSSESLNAITELIKSNSEESTLYLIRALIYLSSEMPKKAESDLVQSLKLNPAQYMARSLLGDKYSGNEEYTKAIESYSTILERHPWRSQDRYKRAVAYLQLEDLDNAQKDVAFLKSRFPDSIAVNYAQGVIEFHNQDIESSINSLKVAELGVGVYSRSLLYLASANLSLGNVLQSEDYANRYFSSNPNDLNGRLMLASIQLVSGKYRESVKLLESLEDDQSENTEFVRVYGAALLSVDKDRGIRYLNKVINEVTSQSTYAMLATAYLSLSHYDSAISTADLGISKSDDSEKLSLIKLLAMYEGGMHREALEVAESLISQYPRENYYSLLSEINFSIGEREKALDILQLMRDEYPGSVAANLKLAGLALERKDTDSAERHYQEIISHSASNERAYVGLYRIAMFKKDLELALDLALKSLNHNPNSFISKDLVANHYLNVGDLDKVRSVYSGDLDAMYIRPISYGLYIRAHMEERQFEDALYHLDRYDELLADSPVPSYLYSQVYFELGQMEKMESRLEVAIEKDSSHFPSHLALSKHYLRLNDERFLGTAERTILINPKNLESRWLQGRVYEKSGDIVAARKIAEEL